VSNPPASIDRYEVKQEIGRGAQGTVYQAYDPNLRIPVAIKVLSAEAKSEEFLERFSIDALIAVQLHHTNVVRVFDFNPRYPYIAMDFCEGGDLTHVLKRRRRMSLKEILSFMRQVCAGLAAAHEHDPPFLHRDIKPGNILFKSGVPKLSDFGLAKQVGGGVTLTRTRGMMGTPAYASPEQVKDASLVDHRSDLWSVGVVLYEMLTWKRPFSKDDDDFVNVAIRVRMEEPFEPGYAIPAPVDRIVRRALQKDPEARFDSAREMAEAMEQAEREVPDAATLLLPPEECVSEVSRLAAEAASHLDAGRVDEAGTLIRRMREASPDDSLVRYWHRRHRDSSAPDRGATPSQPLAAGDTEVQRIIHSITTLIENGRHAEVRKMIGQLMVKGVSPSIVDRLLESLNTKEAQLREDLNRAHEEANRARLARDFPALFAVWEAMNERHPGLEEVKAEFAVATRELELHERQHAFASAEQKAAELERAGQLAEVVEVWESLLAAYPQDARAREGLEAARQRWIAQRRVERVATLREAAGRAEAAGNLDGALEMWREYAAEDPAASEPDPEIARLAAAVEAHRRARRLEETRVEARQCRDRDDLTGAAAAWERLLAEQPTLDEAQRAIAELRAESRARELAGLRGSVDALVAELRRTTAAGRYASLESLPREIERMLGDGAAADSLEALERRHAALTRLAGQAEDDLAKKFELRRINLRRAVRSARELCAARESVGERALHAAVERAIAALCAPAGPDVPGDPVERIFVAEREIAEAGAAVLREREEAIGTAQSRCFVALDDAQQALAALHEGGTGAEDREALTLRRECEALQAEADTKDVRRLIEIEHAATTLAARARAGAGVRAWNAASRLRALVRRARPLAVATGDDGLQALLGRAARCLDPAEGESGPPAQALIGELESRLPRLQESLDERLAAARAHWDEVFAAWSRIRDDELAPPSRGEAESLVASGHTALSRSDPAELESYAVQLEQLTRRLRLESAWSRIEDAVTRVEGPVNAEGVPFHDVDPEAEAVLGSLRRAVVAGSVEEMRTLERRLQDTAEATEDQERGEDGEVPDVGSRQRRLNVRLYPAGLERFDELCDRYELSLRERRGGEAARLAAEVAAAHERLVTPPPLWPGLRVAAVSMLLLGAVAWRGWTRLRPVTRAAVTLLAPEGTVRLGGLFRDGRPQPLPASEVGPEALALPSLEFGTYELRAADGSVLVTFSVPDDRTVMLPVTGRDLTAALARAVLESPGDE